MDRGQCLGRCRKSLHARRQLQIERRQEARCVAWKFVFLEKNWTRENARNEWISELAKACRGSSGGCSESGGWRERFKRMDGVLWIRNSDQRLKVRGHGNCERSRKHKNDGRHRWLIRVVTAGHAALRHGGYAVATIHGVLRTCGRLSMIMPVNGALAGLTTGAGIDVPSRSAERRVEQHHGDQAEHCQERAAPVLRA